MRMQERFDFGQENPEDERFGGKRVVELLHMNEGELLELRERVERNSGTILMAVHPYYDENIDKHSIKGKADTPSPEKIERNKRISGVIDQILASPKDKYPPLVLLEEAEFLKETTAKLGEELSADNNCYVVSTLHDQATPAIEEEDNIQPDGSLSQDANLRDFMTRSMEIAQRNYPRFIDILHQAGVKRIILGGANLVFFDMITGSKIVNDNGELTRDYEIAKTQKQPPFLFNGKCVGQTGDYLCHDFEVVLSNFTAPNNRRDLRKIQEDFGIK